MNALIIQASARSNGDTNRVVSFLNEQANFPYIDLLTKNIQIFSYENDHKEDDFLPIIKDFVENYDTLILATPVYWYSMS